MADPTESELNATFSLMSAAANYIRRGQEMLRSVTKGKSPPLPRPTAPRTIAVAQLIATADLIAELREARSRTIKKTER